MDLSTDLERILTKNVRTRKRIKPDFRCDCHFLCWLPGKEASGKVTVTYFADGRVFEIPDVAGEVKIMVNEPVSWLGQTRPYATYRIER